MKKFLFGTRKRLVAFVAVMALVLSGSALAAWIIYSGGSGTTNSTFATATTNQALTVANWSGDPSAQPISGPGGSGVMGLNITNADPTNAHTITAVTPTITSTPAACASHLTISSADLGPTGLVNMVVPAAGSATYNVHISADSTLPNTCSAGTYSVAWSMTTS